MSVLPNLFAARHLGAPSTSKEYLACSEDNKEGLKQVLMTLTRAELVFEVCLQRNGALACSTSCSQVLDRPSLVGMVEVYTDSQG